MYLPVCTYVACLYVPGCCEDAAVQTTKRRRRNKQRHTPRHDAQHLVCKCLHTHSKHSNSASCIYHKLLQQRYRQLDKMTGFTLRGYAAGNVSGWGPSPSPVITSQTWLLTCRFWSKLTAIKSLVPAEDWVYWGGELPKNLSLSEHTSMTDRPCYMRGNTSHPAVVLLRFQNFLFTVGFSRLLWAQKCGFGFGCSDLTSVDRKVTNCEPVRSLQYKTRISATK